MAGFGKVTFIGEYFNQKIVNVLWYRSTQWIPLQGNPFDDVLAFVDAVLGHMKTQYLQCHNSDYTLLRAEGVGYSDGFDIVTSSPLVRTVNEHGTAGSLGSVGASLSCNIGLRCGEMVQITGIAKSKRNRGYLSIGPLSESYVDAYSHLDTGFASVLDGFAQKLDDDITLLSPAVILTPIRIHTVKAGPIVTGRAYSDVKGYTLPRVASFRRSRVPEA